jgi:hypothetical protein
MVWALILAVTAIVATGFAYRYKQLTNGCDRSLPTPLCRQWRLLSGVGRVDTSERKRF